jgi:hypothetical protein
MKFQRAVREVLGRRQESKGFIIAAFLQRLYTISSTGPHKIDMLTKNARRPSALMRSSMGHPQW